MKNVNNLKKEGYLGLTDTWGQKPLKIWGGKWQKILHWIGQERKRRKGEKNIWKSENRWGEKAFNFSFLSKFNQSSTDQVPIKPDRRFSLKPFEKQIRLIEYQSRINRTNSRPSLKIKGFLIGWKTHSINWNSGKLDYLKNSRSLCRKHSIQIISWMKCMRMSLKVFQKHLFST